MNYLRSTAAAALMLAAFSTVLKALDDPLIISAKYYSIHKITIGASQKEVQAAFGPPKKTERGPSAFCKEESIEDYGGVKANFCNRKLVSRVRSSQTKAFDAF